MDSLVSVLEPTRLLNDENRPPDGAACFFSVLARGFLLPFVVGVFLDDADLLF